MRAPLIEYVLKGIFIGLLLFVVLQEPGWPETGKVASFTLGGLVLALAAAGARKAREGYRARGRWAAYLLFLLLESPGFVYAGVLIGLAAGAVSLGISDKREWLSYMVGAGAGLGVVFWLLRQVGNKWFRLLLSLALASGLVAGALYWLGQHPSFLEDETLRTTVGVQLLLGIPLFYLLTFAGAAEESEVEIGVMCAALGLALWLLLARFFQTEEIIFLIPLVLFVLYTRRVLPGLRVLKHVVRGIGHANVGRYRPALQAYRRALELDPANTLAREHLWRLHRGMDWKQLGQDTSTLKLVDLDLCMKRATALLLEPSPTPEKLAEAQHLLDLVLSQKPALRPAVDYWRAVGYTHARAFDQACESLGHVLDPAAFPPDDKVRAGVLFQAWQLALVLHGELNRRCGTPQLALPGRRMEAIAAVERRLADQPEDAAAWDLKRLLYSSLAEADYQAAGGGRPVNLFDHPYAQQLGLALINDPARWQRGAEYLCIAARGLPAAGPVLFQEVAQAHQRAGDPEGAWRNYELARQAGQAVGPKNLPEEARHVYFGIVKLLGEAARERGDYDRAIENYRLLTESERSGVETLRTLAELYERKGDPLGALRATEQALLYNSKDRDLLERKDRYYYSVEPEDLRRRLDQVRNGFDVDYCLRKARALLDFPNAGPDVIDWAQHLAEVAQVVRPDSVAVKVLRARALRRRGEIEAAQALLEDAYQNKPKSFATEADEEAWFLCCKTLGEMYLNELGKPDQAIKCLLDFRQSPRSGADTMFKLGQAYEQMGDRARARKYYEHVTAYESHPLAPDARDALYRLKSG